MDEFLSEVSALKGQMRARVTLFACDARIADGHPGSSNLGGFPPGEDRRWRRYRFPSVFDWLHNRAAGTPELLVYFTDAQGRFPSREPNFPVIWLVKGKGPGPMGAAGPAELTRGAKMQRLLNRYRHGAGMDR